MRFHVSELANSSHARQLVSTHLDLTVLLVERVEDPLHLASLLPGPRDVILQRDLQQARDHFSRGGGSRKGDDHDVTDLFGARPLVEVADVVAVVAGLEAAALAEDQVAVGAVHLGALLHRSRSVVVRMSNRNET